MREEDGIMKKLSQSGEIWIVRPDPCDLRTAADYAAITLPWTFNRMSLNTSSRGQQERGLNIAKGIVAQEMLHRVLKAKGINAEFQIKSYRKDDLFDFQIRGAQGTIKMDIKSVLHYKDYDPLGREELTPDLIIKNSNYPGPDWRHFFPMLIPHTQINQGKEVYCFSIADSIDFRRSISSGRDQYALTAYPCGEYLQFFSSRKLCQSRENNNAGIFLRISYLSDELFAIPNIHLKVLGEWDGQSKVEDIEVPMNDSVSNFGPYSCVSAFQIPPEELTNFSGKLKVSVIQNDLEIKVYNSSKQNINLEPDQPFYLIRSDFCNLLLPEDYVLYVIGWIPKDEFLQSCRKYNGWVWPNDSKDKFHNQLWSQITDDDVTKLTRAGFEDCIQRNPSQINAGWMKTTGRGNGAACYYFPNMFGGGIRETNLYVLPQDLYIMDDLGKL